MFKRVAYRLRTLLKRINITGSSISVIRRAQCSFEDVYHYIGMQTPTTKETLLKNPEIQTWEHNSKLYNFKNVLQDQDMFKEMTTAGKRSFPWGTQVLLPTTALASKNYSFN